MEQLRVFPGSAAVAERPTGVTCYGDIEDVEQRVGLRAGELMIFAAKTDRFFVRDILRKDMTLGEVFKSNEHSDLTADSVIERIAEVGGKGSAIRIIGSLLENIDAFGFVNGERAEIVAELDSRRMILRIEHKAIKKSQKVESLGH